MIRNTAATLLVAGCLMVAQSAHALDWSDNALRYWYGPSFREPGVGTGQGADISKNILSFTHVDGYKWGGNFLNVDVLLSNSVDRAANSSQGAAEVYAVYRTDLSFNKMSGSKSFSFGPVRDLMLVAGVDLNTKNTAFAPHKVMPVFGPGVAFEVPGFWNVSLLVDKEWNNNGIVNKSVEFDATLMVATAWGIPLGSLPLEFEGFGSVNLPKGKDGFGGQTKTELLFHPKLMGDVGALWGSPKSGYKLGVGWEYWVNKFGNDHNAVPGALASAPFIEAAIHL